MNSFQDKANFIWQVADDILRGVFKQHEYGDVVLPFVALRRLDCVLEDKKDEVIVVDDLLLDFVNTKLDRYKKLTDDKVNVMLNSRWFDGYIEQVRGEGEQLAKR